MARETIGHIRLQWFCPNCGARNPGPTKLCGQCGSPQPEDVEFVPATDEKIIEDTDEIQAAKLGANVHCGYCGARNLAGSTVCSQCGADLKSGKKRKNGTVIGAFQPAQNPNVKCPNCETENPSSAVTCKKCGGSLQQKPASPTNIQVPGKKLRSGVAVLLGVIVLVFCILSLLFFVNSGQSDDIIGTVTSTNWTRSITIEEYGVVTNEGWYNEIPLGAEVLSCSKQFHHAQDEPVEDGEKFCGTPYTIDQGSGYAEVVQDCEYLVHQDFCSYSVNDWQPVDIVTVKGTDQQPEWPDIQYLDNQKPGSMEESYSIQFESNGQMFSYETRDSEKFFNAYIGSRWLLSVNSLGNVVSIQQEQ